MKVAINESTLTAIGEAIREKTGKTDLIAPGSMPAEIRGIVSGGAEVEPIVLTGDKPYGCAGSLASNYIELFGNTISTKNLNYTNYMFYQNTVEEIPFDLHFNHTYDASFDQMFEWAHKLRHIPKFTGIIKPSRCAYMFNYCKNLLDLPEDFGSDWDWSSMHKAQYSGFGRAFAHCHSLRHIPDSFLSNLWGLQTSPYYTWDGMFNECYVLDELINFPIQPVNTTPLSENLFFSTFINCSRLKNLVFTTNEDGTPQTANWKGQTIDLIGQVGYGNTVSIKGLNHPTITTDKEVIDDATYQALKDDPDWFTNLIAYSRYNHDSAVATINSLPDTSAYLATAGGTNTIKFKGEAGSATDGGAINTLTEEEIAVATAKGWTVTLS